MSCHDQQPEGEPASYLTRLFVIPHNVMFPLWEKADEMKTCCSGAVARDFPTSKPPEFSLFPSLAQNSNTLQCNGKGAAPCSLFESLYELQWMCLCVFICAGPVGQSDIILLCCSRPADLRSAQVNDVIHSSCLSLSLSARVLWSIQPD